MWVSEVSARKTFLPLSFHHPLCCSKRSSVAQAQGLVLGKFFHSISLVCAFEWDHSWFVFQNVACFTECNTLQPICVVTKAVSSFPRAGQQLIIYICFIFIIVWSLSTYRLLGIWVVCVSVFHGYCKLHCLKHRKAYIPGICGFFKFVLQIDT